MITVGQIDSCSQTVINELNRLGMVIDLSGTSSNTMRDALNASKAPVVFSHSNARSLCNVTQNVPDDIIRLLVSNQCFFFHLIIVYRLNIKRKICCKCLLRIYLKISIYTFCIYLSIILKYSIIKENKVEKYIFK